jgi:glycosidase
MNLLGTHDTARILTALVDDFDGSREEKARRRLSRNSFDVAYDRLLMASFLQYTLPGTPSLYYGDEAGMEGYKDPFNRRTYPWGRENQELLAHFRWMGQLRKNWEQLRLGDIQFFEAQDQRIGFSRNCNGQTINIYVNRSEDEWEVPAGKTMLYGRNLRTVAPTVISVGPMGFCAVEA